MKKAQVAAVLMAGLAAGPVHAASVTGLIGPLATLMPQATYGAAANPPNADVVFTGTSTVSTCFGFWLQASDAGAKNIYALLLAARVAGRPVRVWANTHETWTGSGNVYCRITTVDFGD